MPRGGRRAGGGAERVGCKEAVALRPAGTHLLRIRVRVRVGLGARGRVTVRVRVRVKVRVRARVT